MSRSASSRANRRGEKSIRELRAEVAGVLALIDRMVATRRSLEA